MRRGRIVCQESPYELEQMTSGRSCTGKKKGDSQKESEKISVSGGEREQTEG